MNRNRDRGLGDAIAPDKNLVLGICNLRGSTSRTADVGVDS